MSGRPALLTGRPWFAGSWPLPVHQFSPPAHCCRLPCRLLALPLPARSITDWTGGLYISPGFAGSRSGALIATAWASLVHLGEEGFLAITDRIMRVGGGSGWVGGGSCGRIVMCGLLINSGVQCLHSDLLLRQATATPVHHPYSQRAPAHRHFMSCPPTHPHPTPAPTPAGCQAV